MRLLSISAVLAVGIHAGVLFCWEFASQPVALMDSPTGTVEVELVGPSPDAEGPPSGNLASMPEPEPSEITMPLQTEQLSLPKPAKKLSSSRPASAPASPHSSSPGVVGESTGRLLGKPAYIVKPSAAYPAESRALGEEGTVVLRITINATGRPTNIRVLASSGFSRLDRAAIEAGWRCRIRNANAGDQFDAPLLFRLQNPR
jgi:protein TonB